MLLAVDRADHQDAIGAHGLRKGSDPPGGGFIQTGHYVITAGNHLAQVAYLPGEFVFEHTANLILLEERHHHEMPESSIGAVRGSPLMEHFRGSAGGEQE